MANLFLAVPELEAWGRKPVVDGRPEAIAELARTALGALIPLPKAGRAAGLAAWRARGVLKRASAEPEKVGEGRLDESEFRRRASLIWTAFRT